MKANTRLGVSLLALSAAMITGTAAAAQSSRDGDPVTLDEVMALAGWMTVKNAAVNLPFGELLTAEGLMREPGALEAAFAARGLGAADRPIASCGSGVTAAVPLLALALLGREGVLYDGSWAEWGGRDDTEIVTGP